MRTFVAFLFCCIVSNSALGDCSGAGLWVFPDNQSLKQNSLIVLTGYSSSQAVLDSLNERYPIYLKSEGHKVKLNVRSKHQGMFRVSQAILEPDEKLIAGREYQLVIENLDKYQSSFLTRWNSKHKKEEPITWLVEWGTDTDAPLLIGQPQHGCSRVKFYGCGPAVHADFKIESNDKSVVLIETEVQNLENNQSVTYYLTYVESDTIRVGHDMCSGPFDFQKDTNYKVRFRLMDICGNENPNWTTWVEFRSPYDED